jgi:hypothetical protein
VSQEEENTSAKDQVKINVARGDRGSPGKQHWTPPGASNNFMKQMAIFTQFQDFQKLQKKAASKKR